MSVDTGGPIRGFVGRWLTYFQAIGGIVRMVSLEITAASTFSVALQNAGHGGLVPWVFAAAVVGTPISAWAYVKLGFYNRKNLENQILGNNFAGPNSAIQAELNARAFAAAQLGRELTDEERAAVRAERAKSFGEYRHGIPVEE